jgi:hypothetical protein
VIAISDLTINPIKQSVGESQTYLNCGFCDAIHK